MKTHEMNTTSDDPENDIDIREYPGQQIHSRLDLHKKKMISQFVDLSTDHKVKTKHCEKMIKYQGLSWKHREVCDIKVKFMP